LAATTGSLEEQTVAVDQMRSEFQEAKAHAEDLERKNEELVSSLDAAQKNNAMSSEDLVQRHSTELAQLEQRHAALLEEAHQSHAIRIAAREQEMAETFASEKAHLEQCCRAESEQLTQNLLEEQKAAHQQHAESTAGCT
ncbi:unnamed protein product, partial [Amoebophrya sp. A25]